MLSMYRLSNSFTTNYFNVTVVGCGGTGGFVADGLCRLLPAQATLVLVDHDQVEERNLIRQNFSSDELGKFKSEALAERLANRYKRPVAYSVLPIGLCQVSVPGLLIGCVDNGPARGQIAEKVGGSFDTFYGFPSWWIDAGNGEHYGQVIIGNGQRGSFNEQSGECVALPLPTLQRPELLSQAPPRERSCVQIDQEQGPTINQAMAAIVVEVTRRIIEGTCSWMQLYLDLEAGSLTNVLATPELVARILKVKLKKRKERR
jgi:hypothetical protein